MKTLTLNNDEASYKQAMKILEKCNEFFPTYASKKVVDLGIWRKSRETERLVKEYLGV